MKWGNTKLNIIKDSYIPPHAEVKYNELALIPGPNNTNPATVIQQGGRGREKVNFNGFVYSWLEYEALETDKINGTARTFEGADGYTKTMIIANLNPTKRTLYPLKIEYSITLLEV
jgi:hypothetical protein